MKNVHAVALGRLGGVKGGPARAKALSAKRRSQIAQQAAMARARSLSAVERRDVAKRAAAARWSNESGITTALDTPIAVRRALENYDPAQLRWAKLAHRYIVAREVLLRGDARAVRWLRGLLSARKLRDLIRSHAGAGCNEPERQKLRATFRLTVHDIPVRGDADLRWRQPAVAR